MSENKSLKLSLIGLDEDECKEVLKVAECLIGSVGFVNIVACGHEPVSGELKAVFCGRFFTETGSSGFTKITLPLSALKVDPWMCAKYGVGIIASYKEMQGGGPMNDKYSFKSHIDKACFLNWWGSNGFDVLDIKFSLIIDNLPKGITLC